MTISPEANLLTLFPNFRSPQAFTFGSGGERPVAAIAGFFNGDAFSDLLVANQGDGVVSLLAGGPGGFSLADSYSADDLPHPAALASVFRGGKIEIYGVNEHGSEAVLVRSLLDPMFRPPDGSPVPLAGLLLVVAPGLELAMSVLTVDALVGEVNDSAASAFEESVSSDTASISDEGGGSEELEDGQQQGDSATPEDAEELARDAAILELLSGVEEALALRPPQLAWDENSADGQPDERATAANEAAWFEAALGSFRSADWSGLAVVLPLPPGIGTVTNVALVVARQWFPGLLAAEMETLPVVAGEGTAAHFASAADELMAGDAWTVDPWVAAIALIGLATGACNDQRRAEQCCEFHSRRARFPVRPRPSS